MESDSDECDIDVKSSDLEKPLELDKVMLCSSLCKFVTEVESKRGDEYPPNMIKEMIACI